MEETLSVHPEGLLHAKSVLATTILHNRIHSWRYQYSWSKRTGSEPTSVTFERLFI